MQISLKCINRPFLLGGREGFRQAFLKKVVTALTVDVLLASLSSSKMKQSDALLKVGDYFRGNNGYNFYELDSLTLLEFLSQKFSDGALYGTLNFMRSPISLLGKKNLQKNVLLNRFFR